MAIDSPKTPAARRIPPELSDQVAGRLTAWTEASGTGPDAALRMLFACSDFAAACCIREPEIAASLYQPARDIEIPADADQATAMQLLRRHRNQALVRIIWRDLNGQADTNAIMSDLSQLADSCIRSALYWAHTSVEKNHGVLRDADGAPQSLIIIAMGKLGGGELNFSSDVDLVLLYPEAGESDGPKPLNADRYFARVGQQLISLLEQRTDDGFVYRVDTLLRPFGKSGALCLSFSAFETYLQQHGREWERYAYIKARPITGNAQQKSQFLELVRPFIYRRYLDYGVLESLREMKALVAADVARRRRHDDIKLGPGGIREVEFIVQSFQLLRGGGDPSLRGQSLLATLGQLAVQRCLSATAASELEQAYRFLRRLENRLQYWRDEQTHQLPGDAHGQSRIAFTMGYSSWSEFMIALDQQRTIVSERFAAAVVGQSEQPVDVLAAVWKADPGSAEAGRQIQALGFESAATVQGKLKVLHDSAQYRHLDTRGRKRFDALIPRILRLAAKQEDAAETVYRLLNILVAVGRRSAYFALLNENPQVLERLAGLCAQSSWLASQVASHPILLDELIDPRLFESLPTRADFSADLQRRFAAIQQQDLEAEMEALRRFQQAAVFRVAVADLSGVLPLMKVSDRLTDVAELVLEKTLQLARTEMQARYGRPRCGEPGDMREVGFAVIGYGKLGGLELGYASDLDLVFLHDGAGSVQQTDGKAGLDNARYFARLGQRILHILGTTTAAGVLYEVDTRLRPSGKGGSMVSSIASFDNYQQQSAWTWEHQALLRARAVAGDRSVSEAFETIRQRVLAKARDPAVLKDEVLSMRQRMRRELAGGGAGVFNIKRDRGGLTDLEFLVQYWVLANAETQPAMLRWSDNIRQLEELANAAIVPAEMAARLTDIYRQYRQRLHRLALANKDKCVPEQEFAGQRQQICEVWCSVFGE